MSRFRISSHGRLQDWIAVENRFFERWMQERGLFEEREAMRPFEAVVQV
jgi:hypothetical protein